MFRYVMFRWNIGVPVVHPVVIPVPHPVAVTVPQPYPVHVPIAQPIAVPVVKTIAIPVEKKMPYPVEKIVPVPVEKAVQITVEKHIPVPVEKPYPIHIPVYKHVFHRKTKSHGHGHHGWIHWRKNIVTIRRDPSNCTDDDSWNQTSLRDIAANSPWLFLLSSTRCCTRDLSLGSLTIRDNSMLLFL